MKAQGPRRDLKPLLYTWWTGQAMRPARQRGQMPSSDGSARCLSPLLALFDSQKRFSDSHPSPWASSSCRERLTTTSVSEQDILHASRGKWGTGGEQALPLLCVKVRRKERPWEKGAVVPKAQGFGWVEPARRRECRSHQGGLERCVRYG